MFIPLTPSRVFDTRTTGGVSGFVAGGEAIDVYVVSDLSSPLALSLNVTATQSGSSGYITAYPAGTDRPTASVLNLNGAGETRPNAAILGIGEGSSYGSVSFFSSGGAHLLADMNGYFIR